MVVLKLVLIIIHSGTMIPTVMVIVSQLVFVILVMAHSVKEAMVGIVNELVSSKMLLVVMSAVLGVAGEEQDVR
jgi:hypothetical protein